MKTYKGGIAETIIASSVLECVVMLQTLNIETDPDKPESRIALEEVQRILQRVDRRFPPVNAHFN